ncbi:MAG: RNA polymerase sigma-70 factor [Balneolaceae bacterium]|nr:RNA polymerase sigma-70 factor [Balneolaceae bacterium]
MHDSAKPTREDLLRWAQKTRLGDHTAFKKLFKHFHAPLCEFVFKYVKNKQSAEDIVQRLFLDIYEKGNNWNPRNNVKTYIYTSARNQALNYLRDNKKHISASAIDKTMHSILQHSHIEEEQHARDLRQAIQKAYGEMPEQRRLIFLLSRESDLTYKEISSVLDISIKTVETQMGRALKALRKELHYFFSLVKN